MATPIVSVLIPVYNVEEYLEKCIKSVMAQTLNNIEIICVNDGSTDGSLKILEKYKALDKRIKVVNKENGGLPSARNAGLEIARGKYIGFVDSDDYIEPQMYEVLVENARKNHSDVVICGANIFPENPRADQWLYDTLSPWYRHYEEFDSDILFKMIDTTPFLWRTIISKRLIDSHNFRLDENIVLGEDKAFQCMVYPYAKGITVIPDKLYNYYWCRPGSLMAEGVYNNISVKVQKHLKLVVSIANYISTSELSTQNKKKGIKNYLDWCIPFIYSDFISCNYNDKIQISKELMKCFTEVSAMQFWGQWEEWKQKQYKYIKLYEKAEPCTEKQLSIIIPAEYEEKYMYEALKNIVEIADDEIEFIIVNNGMSHGDYGKLLKLMDKVLSVRLYNTTKHVSYAEILNTGIALATGKYVAFLEPQDWYESKEMVVDWFKYADTEKYDCCIGMCIKKETTSCNYGQVVHYEKQNVGIWENDFCNVLFRTEFIKENKFLFKEYSVLTGYEFWVRVVLNAESIGFFNKYVYNKRRMWKQDWLKTEKIVQMLEGMESIVQKSIKYNKPFLHGKVYSMLNSDEIKNIIVNGTKMYYMPEGSCPNGENGQIDTLSKLYSIMQCADKNMLQIAGFDGNRGIYDLLYDVISERQKFLAHI